MTHATRHTPQEEELINGGCGVWSDCDGCGGGGGGSGTFCAWMSRDMKSAMSRKTGLRHSVADDIIQMPR